MHARLGFSIAAHVDPEILLVDEVLAVGDFAFQTKCYARMDELRRKGTSLIFVSHNMDVVRRVCDRGLVMYRGDPIFQGSAAEAVVAYSDAIRDAARHSYGKKEVNVEGGLSQRVMTFDAEIERVALVDENGLPQTVLDSGATAAVALDVRFNKEVENPIFAFTVRTPDGRLIYNHTTDWMEVKTPRFQAGERCRVLFQIQLPLLEGQYDLGADIASPDLRYYYDRVERAMGFVVRNKKGAKGLADLDARFSIQPIPEGMEVV
jgi:hypothetical protein